MPILWQPLVQSLHHLLTTLHAVTNQERKQHQAVLQHARGTAVGPMYEFTARN
jgi:hypothetical protein